MFSHFIYFIIALLILSLYEAPENLPFTFLQSISLISVLGILYGLYTRTLYSRLLKRMEWENQARLDHQFGVFGTRCSVLALVLLAADIWWLHLPAFLDEIQIFSLFPTLRSLLLLLLFVGYLAVMWALSFRAHRAIYRTDISFGNYIYSNVAFSIPVLIPWTLLFGIHDMIRLLPYKLPQRILETPIGQTSYFLIFLIMTAIIAPMLVQKFWRCSPLEPGAHRSRIEALCRKADVQYADIVYWPIFGGRMITAGVMGLVARFRYILVTEALLDMLTAEEVDQVIAHEIGHVKHRHLLLYLLFFIGFMLITYMVHPVSVWLVFSNEWVYRSLEAMHFNPKKVSEILFGVALIVCIVIYFRFVFGFFIRNFERQADGYVFRLFPTARPLISTFRKIVASSGQPADKPNWHHFSIQQRIDYLWRCEESRNWISRHNRKVARYIVVFIASVLIFSVASFKLNKMVFHQGKEHFDVAMVERYLAQKTVKTNEDALLYLFVGNFYFDKGNEERALRAYEASLLQNPDNPETLNNLAWLLVTSKNKELKDPVRALALAQQALHVKRAPHILDTLAECYFANGRIREAVEAEKQALQMKPKDSKIYLDQLAKFEKALEEKMTGQDPDR